MVPVLLENLRLYVIKNKLYDFLSFISLIKKLFVFLISYDLIQIIFRKLYFISKYIIIFSIFLFTFSKLLN